MINSIELFTSELYFLFHVIHQINVPLPIAAQPLPIMRERERENEIKIYIFFGLLMNSTTISVLRYCSFVIFTHQNIDPDAQCFSGFSYYFGKMLIYLACYECSYTTHQFAKTIPLFAKLPIVRTSNKSQTTLRTLLGTLTRQIAFLGKFKQPTPLKTS